MQRIYFFGWPGVAPWIGPKPKQSVGDMVQLDAINLKVSPVVLEQIKIFASAAGFASLSFIINVADGAPIPFAKVVGGLAKLVQDQADASVKSEQYALEAKKRAAATEFQVL